jgi:hypothetical protein
MKQNINQIDFFQKKFRLTPLKKDGGALGGDRLKFFGWRRRGKYASGARRAAYADTVSGSVMCIMKKIPIDSI